MATFLVDAWQKNYIRCPGASSGENRLSLVHTMTSMVSATSKWWTCFVLLGMLFSSFASAQTIFSDNKDYHLGTTSEPEWKGLKAAPRKELILQFTAKSNNAEYTLACTQEDVKLAWVVKLNGANLGNLQEDENTMVTYFRVPAGMLKDGTNELSISPADSAADDIHVRGIRLMGLPPGKWLTEVAFEFKVMNKLSSELIPSQLTIVDSRGALHPFAAEARALLALRTGCIYTGDGIVTFSLPVGNYKAYATAGFQYGVDSFQFSVRRGDTIKRNFYIRKELELPGWIACDPHIHTLTYSGHGDASMTERLITIAAEGIQLPVITEHNRITVIDSLARSLNLRRYFTPVAGDEYTTNVGHFNVFPWKGGDLAPEHRVENWESVSAKLGKPEGQQIIILNHARDLHNNFIPFGPQRHIGIAGEALDGWEIPANAMEVINSSAQQADVMQLYQDWFGMINHGKLLTPVGASDSHDVNRYKVGQARTYIRYGGTDLTDINISEAIQQFRAGEVMVSFGLAVTLKLDSVDGDGGPVAKAGSVKVTVNVLAPSWTEADNVTLFTNGKKIGHSKIRANHKGGIKWEGSWVVPVANQDLFLVAVATGPDPARPYWRIPKPYQPIASPWKPRLVGSSGAVWVDGDHDGKKTSAFDYASRIVDSAHAEIPAVVSMLTAFDESVSIQAASILHQRKKLSASADLENILAKAASHVKTGFFAYLRALSSH